MKTLLEQKRQNRLRSTKDWSSWRRDTDASISITTICKEEEVEKKRRKKKKKRLALSSTQSTPHIANTDGKEEDKPRARLTKTCVVSNSTVAPTLSVIRSTAPEMRGITVATTVTTKPTSAAICVACVSASVCACVKVFCNRSRALCV